MEGELWRPIVGYARAYEVSNRGRVRSLPTKTHPGRLLKQYLDTPGYPCVTLACNGADGRVQWKVRNVHKLVADAFIPVREDGANEIDHINGIRTDNNLENLRRCTHKENMNNPISIARHREIMLKRVEEGKCLGHKMTPAELQAHRERLGRRVIDLNTGKIYLSVHDAAEKLGVSYASIYDSIKRQGKPRKKKRDIWRDGKPVLSFAYLKTLNQG